MLRQGHQGMKRKRKQQKNKKAKIQKNIYRVAFHRLNFEDSFEYPHSSVIL
jgi:hypothetical protein